MKKALNVLIVLNLLFIAVIGGLAYLAETYPLHTGDPLYQVQRSAEYWKLILTMGKARQADVALQLADRHLAELAAIEEPGYITSAASRFNQSLNEAIFRIEAAPAHEKEILYGRLSTTLHQADTVFKALEASGNNPVVRALRIKIEKLESATTSEELLAALPEEVRPPTKIDAVAIPFLGRDVDHEDFPLTGVHMTIDCFLCHEDGRYAETPTDCESCHEASGTYTYPDHFAGACDECHTTETWVSYQFDHDGVSECYSCHWQGYSRGHYPGACIDCHTDVESWEVNDYEHLVTADCQSCHLNDAPDGYLGHYGRANNRSLLYVGLAATTYNNTNQIQNALTHKTLPGYCDDCHSDVVDWANVTFNHSGYEDCLSCHQQDNPVPHYHTQCARCHDTSDWETFVFNHTGYTNCVRCHEAPKPHSTNDCTDCHHAYDWSPIDVDHSELSECQECHAEEIPINHYDDQCTNCHNVYTWDDVIFNHSGQYKCADCHIAPSGHPSGQCSTCHNIDNWPQIWFSHKPDMNCQNCHHTPSNHYEGQCSSCHNTDRWGDAAPRLIAPIKIA